MITQTKTAVVPTMSERNTATAITTKKSFPPALFDKPVVAVDDIYALDYPVAETTYLAIGGGLGSFAWVDALRVSGVPTAAIKVVGFEAKPYGRYRRLAENSQIPEHERLRSNSDACPDNLWGWPGYGVREIAHHMGRGSLFQAGRIAWQLFAEPLLAEPYTPRAGDVYHAIDREAERIGWQQMWRYGRVRAVRRTEDGRYVIAYSQGREVRQRHRFIIATYLHMAVGYPALRFLPDLQSYRETTGDFRHVVNAYEDHDHLYEQLAAQGGTVLIRGRGIVASRIIQRLYEVQQEGAKINIVHVMRTPIGDGSKFGLNQREVRNHWQLQPYNFPKACFGGDLKMKLATMPEAERAALLDAFGGTTTADRRDWQRIIDQGLAEGWYHIRFGETTCIEREEGHLVTCLSSWQGYEEAVKLHSDFIIDATGLQADITTNPLLADLVAMYDVQRNHYGRLHVTDHYEMPDMRQAEGRMYAAGAMTFGSTFAPVDSFLGLQYVAQRAVDDLLRLNAPYLKQMHGVRSLAAWWRWARGKSA